MLAYGPGRTPGVTPMSSAVAVRLGVPVIKVSRGLSPPSHFPFGFRLPVLTPTSASASCPAHSGSHGRSPRPRPPPDPDKEISTIRLLRHHVSRTCSPEAHHGARPREPSGEFVEPRPREAPAVAASPQPLEPRTSRPVVQRRDRSAVPTDGEVVHVPLDAPRQRRALLVDRAVPMATAPVVYRLDRLREPRAPSFTCDSPSCSLHGPRPPPGETEEVEGARTSTVRASRPPEIEQPGLFGMESKAEPSHPLLEHAHHPLGVLPVREPDHQVIGVANERCPSEQPRFDLALEPQVEHMVQVHVAEERREDRSLRGTQLC
jgi:hypothetical protein